jgi:hypothetical protein
MIETSFRTLLVTAPRRSHTGAPGLAATRRRAVDVSSIAGGTNAKRLCTRSARAHPKRRLHEAAAPSARPRPSAALSGRMKGDWVGLPQRRVGHEGLEVTLQVLTPRSAAHTLSHILSPSHSARPAQSTECQSGPILASNPGSILASAEVITLPVSLTRCTACDCWPPSTAKPSMGRC